MTNGRKIDLALEAKELAEHTAQETTALPGVKAREETLLGFPLTRVDILDQRGAQAVGKPQGNYLTLTLPQLPQGWQRCWGNLGTCPRRERCWWRGWATGL